MKTKEALKLYNESESAVKRDNPGLNHYRRAAKILDELELRHGEDKSDEILELVFAHEFYPVGLNKNE